LSQSAHIAGLAKQDQESKEKLVAATYALEEADIRQRLITERDLSRPETLAENSSTSAISFATAVELDFTAYDEPAPVWDLTKLTKDNAAAKLWVIAKPSGYFCAICLAAKQKSKTGAWTTKAIRNKNMNEAITKHKKHKSHEAAVCATSVAKSIPKHVEDLNARELVAVTKRMRDIFHIVKKDHALSDLPSLLELESANGAYVGYEDVLQSKNAKYTGDKFCKAALRAIANTVRVLYIQPKLYSSTVLGLTADEGSCQQQSQQISYYRVTHAGRPENIFAGLDRLENGKAQTKYLHLRHRIAKDDVKPC
jgi:hypothetical protein